MKGRYKINWLIILFFSIFLLNACCLKQTKPGIALNLIEFSKSSNQQDSLTALLLLQHISLSDNELKKLINEFENSKNHIKKLFLAYVLIKRTQEYKFVNAFVDLYPVGKKQQHIWETSRNKTNYISVSSPLQKLLASIAKTNQTALKKLLSGYKFADGADAESLAEEIKNIYNYSPVTVLNECKKANIDLSQIGIR